MVNIIFLGGFPPHVKDLLITPHILTGKSLLRPAGMVRDVGLSEAKSWAYLNVNLIFSGAVQQIKGACPNADPCSLVEACSVAAWWLMSFRGSSDEIERHRKYGKRDANIAPSFGSEPTWETKKVSSHYFCYHISCNNKTCGKILAAARQTNGIALSPAHQPVKIQARCILVALPS